MENSEIILENKSISIKNNLIEKFLNVRKFSDELCSSLKTEDYVIQSMPDVSPTKWHLAHTSWFFEAFILQKGIENYISHHPQYNYLFNSYYVQMGSRYVRAHRGLLSRPTVDEVYSFRNYVNERMISFMESTDAFEEYASLIEIGINHEQQHQELILTDIKHVLSINPLHPVFINSGKKEKHYPSNLNWVEFIGGITEIGHSGGDFAYDNELSRHKVYIQPFLLGDRLITNGEYLEFIEDKGYERPELWLSDGYVAVENEKWKAPLYWEKIDGEWMYFTLHGFEKIFEEEPVSHISHYEADAFARWKDARLPTEFEWEYASKELPVKGNFVEDKLFHPAPVNALSNGVKLNQMYGDVWEWTRSAYLPYPGFKVAEGALGEYNGKFMSGQMVLRGGSCATSVTHIRSTYRNFFPPNARWQFTGIRLAKDL